MALRPPNHFHSDIYPYSQGTLDNRDNCSYNNYKHFHPLPEISFLPFSLGIPLDSNESSKAADLYQSKGTVFEIN